MTRDRLLEQAFELLAIADFHSLTLKEERNQVVREGIELLRQPKPDQNELQEPVCPECKAVVLYECAACSSNNYPPQRTEQEPVAPKCGAIIEVFGKDWRLEYMSLPVGKHKLYTQQYTHTAPPQRKPLTDEQIWELAANCLDSVAGRMQFARAIEAAHGIKGEA